MIKSQRLLSIDVLRGFTIALMIVVNNPGSWANIFAPLEHAQWHGITPTDWVFPFFLGIVGMSIYMVKPRWDALPNDQFFRKILVRSSIIFGFGLLLNAAPFFQFNGDELQLKPLESLRIMGVLQRIAVCFLITSILTRYFKVMTLHYIVGCLLLLYWWMCMYGSNNTDGDIYSLSSYFGTSWDIALFGESHLYHGEGVAFDPEGISSTLPSIATTLLGFLSLYYVQQYQQSTRKMLYILIVAVVLMNLSYYGWDILFPINKKIWTSSYVLYTSSLCMIWLILLHFLLDRHCFDGQVFFHMLVSPFAFFFKVLGTNAIFIYLFSGILVRVLTLFRWKQISPLDPTQHLVYTPWKYLYEQIALPIFTHPQWASLYCALMMLMLMWAVSWILYRYKIFIKI